MWDFGEEDEQIKERVADDFVIHIMNWKDRLRRYRIYRTSLFCLLVISLIVLSAYSMNLILENIPSEIKVRSNSREIIELNIPMATASVSAVGESNIPADSINVSLNEPITIVTGSKGNISMNVSLFGWLPLKEVMINVVDDTRLIPGGVPVGIYLKCDGIMVVGTGEFQNIDGETVWPCENILKSGDYIHYVNGIEISGKQSLLDEIKNFEGEHIVITVERNNELMDLKIIPQRDLTGDYKIGCWVRDNSQGVGTLTYLDEQGNFGALGHSINDVDTSLIMEIDSGILYQSEIVSVKKGESGNPGEIVGLIRYNDENVIGEIEKNCTEGIFGKDVNIAENYDLSTPIPVGFKQDVRKGRAYILSTVSDGDPQCYEIEITGMDYNSNDINKGLEIKVTDQKLIDITGGIIQGMSGSPIIQNGQIVGAVTHVLINDPTRGYGIFIENMLEH